MLQTNLLLAVNGFSIPELNYAVCLLGLVLPLSEGFELHSALWALFLSRKDRFRVSDPNSRLERISRRWNRNRTGPVRFWVRVSLTEMMTEIRLFGPWSSLHNVYMMLPPSENDIKF